MVKSYSGSSMMNKYIYLRSDVFPKLTQMVVFASKSWYNKTAVMDHSINRSESPARLNILTAIQPIKRQYCDCQFSLYQL